MPNAQELHESYAPETEVAAGSERAFGVVFSVVFAAIGLLPLWGGQPVRIWALVIGAIFLALGFVAPKTLRPLNLVWFRFGMLLHKIVNPLIMGLLFFLTVTPIALIMRLMGKDSLNRNFDAQVDSYWIERDATELQPETMRRQF